MSLSKTKPKKRIVVEQGAPGWAAMVSTIKTSETNAKMLLIKEQTVKEDGQSTSLADNHSSFGKINTIRRLRTHQINPRNVSNPVSEANGIKFCLSTSKSNSRLLRQCQKCGILFETMHSCR